VVAVADAGGVLVAVAGAIAVPVFDAVREGLADAGGVFVAVAAAIAVLVFDAVRVGLADGVADAGAVAVDVATAVAVAERVAVALGVRVAEAVRLGVGGAVAVAVGIVAVRVAVGVGEKRTNGAENGEVLLLLSVLVAVTLGPTGEPSYDQVPSELYTVPSNTAPWPSPSEKISTVHCAHEVPCTGSRPRMVGGARLSGSSWTRSSIACAWSHTSSSSRPSIRGATPRIRNACSSLPAFSLPRPTRIWYRTRNASLQTSRSQSASYATRWSRQPIAPQLRRPCSRDPGSAS